MSDLMTIRREHYEALLRAVHAMSEVEQDEIIVTAPRPEPETDDAAFAFSDYGEFYEFLRGNRMLGPAISADEFEGCDKIIKACAEARWPVSWVAYALGTAYHETAHTMQPIKERGGDAYFTRMYDIQGQRPAKARELGNLTPGDGRRYPGRGYVQLTGLVNYRKAGNEIGLDLVADPDLAMNPDVAAKVMVIGMTEGWFTARKVSDDLPRQGAASLRQFVVTRDVINGSDKDDEIAAYAIDFQTALQQGGYRV